MRRYTYNQFRSRRTLAILDFRPTLNIHMHIQSNSIKKERKKALKLKLIKVKMIKWSKALDSSSASHEEAWVQIPLLKIPLF